MIARWPELVLPRSLLYVPGNSSDLVAKAARSAADAVVVDLEDSVPPGEKE
ncbi:MAG TPA: aldolase/citrate lyase family protein, partial [Nocardioides sp.]|nr:aldolase/citrate lyase family protein [Nocardioides sp.]